MRVNNLVYAICIILVMQLAFVSALDPDGQAEGFSNGLTVEFPDFNVHQNSQDLALSFHVYNTTNGGFKTNADTSCFFRAYSGSTGTDTLSTTALTFSNPNVFSIVVPASNYTNNGEYGFVMQCNTTLGQAGFVSNSFTVTPNGQLPSIPQGIFYLIILGVLLFFICLMFFAHLQDQSHLARFWWFSFMWIPFWAIVYIMWNMSINFLPSETFLAGIFYFAWLVLAIIYPLYLLCLTLYTFYWVYKQQEVQRLITRGFTVEDAQGRVNGRGRGGRSG